ncbi:MAG: SLC13 family permease, partial [Bacteroidota bacterium]|nr:SLC13 family permease [Bacteroidota bacterium]
MTFEMWVVIVLLLTAIVLFSTERIGVDMTAMLIMTALLLTGVLTPDEGFSGFSNTATVTVAAMFVISAGLRQTGAVSFIAMLSTRIFTQSYWAGIALTMPLIGIASAFVN